MAGVLFEDIFDVKDIDPDGKKFDRGLHSPGHRRGRDSSDLPVYSFTADIFRPTAFVRQDDDKKRVASHAVGGGRKAGFKPWRRQRGSGNPVPDPRAWTIHPGQPVCRLMFPPTPIM
ncbi:hypothetical protein BaRGS_00021132 [Batillaria attramentaria]|uniref:Uncharacterized protein n=1 Tax=Batillaria attramentaria TaxID=370345 RepID=A0ABD0KKK7_9CAEN